MFLVYNSDILPEGDLRLSVNDRAFHYGDGLFETIRYENGQIWFWTDHFARLSAGMMALHLMPPDAFTADSVHHTLLQLLVANELINQPARIRIQVWRQPGGLYTPTTNQADILITAQPGKPFSISEKANTETYDQFRLSPSPVSAFKTLNALPYVLAGLYKEQHKLDDVLLLDTDGHLAECIASNLFWFASKTLHTPSLQTGCINGILRQQLLRVAPKLRITVAEGLYEAGVLAEADAIFCANVMGIQWLRCVNGVYSDTSAPSFRSSQTLLNALFTQLHS